MRPDKREMSQGVHPAPTAAQKCLAVSWVRDSLFLGGACGWVGGCRWRLLCFANQTLSFLAEVLGEQWRVNHAIRSHLAILSARLARARTGGRSKGEEQPGSVGLECSSYTSPPTGILEWYTHTKTTFSVMYLKRKKERKQTTQERDGRTTRRHHTGILKRGSWLQNPFFLVFLR